ncbi:MAG: LutB/LldF family L-lactate oxidation iron-sulfur protein [Bacteroidota bacterium]|nr:LutB/LldF family L-lactate oxidation iron-sulfur protein [Bacteroidota bacterium]
MAETHKKFLIESAKKAFDLEHREKINFNISTYDHAVIRGKEIFKDLDLAKKRAAFLKTKVINSLEKHLNTFMINFERRGGKVIWAEDAHTAVMKIMEILQAAETKAVVKSKSMITEEIDLNSALEKHDIESLETDLGEYIVQLAEEKPYHIVTPAMHMSKKDVAELFHKKFDVDPESSPEDITAFVRKLLRKKFTKADVGITGSNFIIADVGGIALTENEGNGMLSFSFPRIHIAVTGIEKVIPSMNDLDTFWPLLATHGTGQYMTVYNSLLLGPRQNDEVDGPEEMYVVLLDNGRTELLKHVEQRVALNCIRCGACLNACPVYKNIGGHTYRTTYSGPIGAVITPHMRGMEKFKHLSFASSLCGRCTEVCPVNIPLHELLLQNRNESVEKGYTTAMERLTMKGWKKTMKNRSMMDMVGGDIKNMAMKRVFHKAWGSHRALPEVSKKSFKKLYRSRKTR